MVLLCEVERLRTKGCLENKVKDLKAEIASRVKVADRISNGTKSNVAAEYTRLNREIHDLEDEIEQLKRNASLKIEIVHLRDTLAELKRAN